MYKEKRNLPEQLYNKYDSVILNSNVTRGIVPEEISIASWFCIYPNNTAKWIRSLKPVGTY